MKEKKNPKKILRMCIVSRKSFEKKDLIRICKTKQGDICISSDAPGRGIYLSKDKEVIKTFIKRRMLEKVFKINKNLEEIYKTLEEFVL